MIYDELKEEIEKIVDQKNSEFNAKFNEARKQTVRIVVEKYKKDHPDATEADIKKFIEDYLAEEPDELLRQFRLYSNSFGALFNLTSQLLNEVADLKQLYIVCNDQKINAAARKHAKILAAQQEEDKKEEK